MINKQTTVEELINLAIEECKDDDNFTAYDVTSHVHELIRHKNIRNIIHEIIRSNTNIEQVSSTPKTTGGKIINAISYKHKNKNILQYANDRLILSIYNGIPGDRFFLMTTGQNDELVLTNEYYDYPNGNVLASYYVQVDSTLDVNETRINNYFAARPYEVLYENNEVFFKVK